MKANDRQIGGDHYRKKGTELQHWDYAEMKGYDKFQYVISKYLERWRDKNGIVDLEKAQHYLEKYIEIEKAKHEKVMEEVTAASSHGVRKEFGARIMPPKVQRLEDRLPDLSGQKHPFGFDPKDEVPYYNEKAAEDIFPKK